MIVEKCPSQIHKTQGDVFKSLPLSDQQSTPPPKKWCNPPILVAGTYYLGFLHKKWQMSNILSALLLIKFLSIHYWLLVWTFASSNYSSCVFFVCGGTHTQFDEKQHWDGCTAFATVLTPALHHNITQPMEHIHCRVLAACSTAPETQYWSDPCITGSQCSIAIEPARKTWGKQTPNLLRVQSKSSIPHNAHWVVTVRMSHADIHQKQQWLWHETLAALTLMTIFRQPIEG